MSLSGEEVREEWCVIGKLREVRERLSSMCHWYTTGFIWTCITMTENTHLCDTQPFKFGLKVSSDTVSSSLCVGPSAET